MDESTSEDESRRPRRPAALEQDLSPDPTPRLSGTGVQPLIGRRRELETLEHAIRSIRSTRSTRSTGELRAGSCRVLEVVGEPGIGKTRLLAELAVRAASSGLPHLKGRATEFERDVPFGVVVQAIDNHLAILDPGRLQEIGAGWIDLLDQVFPSLSTTAGRGRSVPGSAAFDLLEVERHRLYHAVRVLVEELAAPDGLALVLDDMHWADQATVELLTYFLRHTPRAPVLLVLAYRPRQVSVRLAAGLTEAARDGLVERIELGPLTIEETGELLGSRIGRSRCLALYEASGGNPFYLEALARTTLGTGGHPGAGESIGDVPRGVALALLAELDVLSGLARLMSQAAAVVGDPFEPEFAAKVAGLEQSEGLAALDELIACDLVRPSSLRGFRYRHPLVRSVAYEATAAGWRLAAHARAAAVLGTQGASVVSRAHHVARAAEVGDEGAIAVLVEAAQETMVRAPATSVHWLQAAIRLAGAEEASQRRLELLLRFANALFTVGRLHDCLGTLHEVLRLLPPELAESRTRAAVLCAMAEGQLGRHAQARALLLGELTALGEQETPQATSLKLELAARSLSSGDVDASRAWAGEVLKTARSSQNRALQAAASGVLAMASCTTGAIDEAAVCTDETASHVDALPDTEFVHCLDTFVSLGWSEQYLDRHDDALRHLTRGLAVAHATGQGWIVPHLLVGLTRVLGLLGHLTEAAGYADDSVETALLAGSDELQTMALTMQCWIATLAGDLETALQAGRQAVDVTGGVSDRWSALALAVMGDARRAAGDAQGCVEAVLEAGGGPGLEAIVASTRASFYEMLVQAELDLGRPAAAGEWVDRADAIASRLQLTGSAGYALLARARLLASSSASDAAEHALSAAAAFMNVNQRLDAGRAHLCAGTALAAAGRRPAAADELERAEALLGACGASRLHEQAGLELQRHGRRVTRPRQRSVPAGRLGTLTFREREIAELVSEGFTNHQIARALSLSDKTVETHLSRIFGKLEVSSRAAVASTVTRAKASPAPNAGA